MKIPHSRPSLDRRDIEEVGRTMRSGFLSTGPECAKFAALCARIMGRIWAIPTQSGTDALVAALRLLRPGKNAKIAVPAYVCSAILDAVHAEGLVPVPVDIDRESLAISADPPGGFPDVGGVVAAHLFGIPAPLERIRNRNLIEDCAQTLGTFNRGGKKIGSIGRFSICSFYATKILTTGHGGAIAGDDDKSRRAAVRLFTHDKQDRWEPHLHFLMSDFNAALGLTQARRLDKMIARRREIAARFAEALGSAAPESVFSRFLVVPEKEGNAGRAIELFSKKGIEAKKPVYKPIYEYMNLKGTDFPNARWAHRNLVSIPIYPAMPEAHIKAIVKMLGELKDDLRCWPPA